MPRRLFFPMNAAILASLMIESYMCSFTSSEKLNSIKTIKSNKINDHKSSYLCRNIPKRSPIDEEMITTNGLYEDETTRFYSFVIIGYGVAGSAAVEGILANFPGLSGRNSMLIIDKRLDLEERVRKLKLSNANSCVRDIDFMNGSIVDMDCRRKVLILDNGKTIRFDKLLLSIGASSVPLNMKFISKETVDIHKDIVELNDSIDRNRLFDSVSQQQHVTLIGGNSWATIDVASQLASLTTNAKQLPLITIVLPSYGLMSSILPRYLSIAISKRLSSRGVEILPYSQVGNIYHSI